MKYIYLNLSIALNVASYLVYKSISNIQQSAAWFLIFTMGLLLGGLNVFFFTKALKYIRLNIAYPIFSGACIFIIVIFSYVLFGEKISTINMIGAVLVTAGIVLLSN
jgi:multidrug transporter EmrE-like cation transporter